MLTLINEVLTMAPELRHDSDGGDAVDAILDWAMGTPAGFAAFRDPRINAMIKKILNVWCEFFSAAGFALRPQRRPDGLEEPGGPANAIDIDQYEHDPQRRALGFQRRGTTSSRDASRTASVRSPIAG